MIDGRPAIGFAHTCTYPVEIVLGINSGAFTANDADIVVASNHLESMCQPSGDGANHECRMVVQPNANFGILLNAGYNGHYSSAFNV